MDVLRRETRMRDVMIGIVWNWRHRQRRVNLISDMIMCDFSTDFKDPKRVFVRLRDCNAELAVIP